MVINAKTKISELIKKNPATIDALAEFNSNFNKLRNPILRNLLARRVSIVDACRIGGCELSGFLDKMASIGFEIEGSVELPLSPYSKKMGAPGFITDLKVMELDVRPMLAGGEDPLKLILKKCKELKSDECLKIVNTFEPLPLISLLEKQGFKTWTERPDINTVFTWFIRIGKSIVIPEPSVDIPDPVISDQEFDTQVKSFPPEKIHTIDVRHLAMPLPMMTILDHLSKLEPDEALFVFHKKIPVYLLPELAERGFKYFIQHSANGEVNMLIRRS